MLALQAVNNSNINLDSQGFAHSEGISSTHADSIVFERVVGSLSSLASPSTLSDSPVAQVDGVECLALETRP